MTERDVKATAKNVLKLFDIWRRLSDEDRELALDELERFAVIQRERDASQARAAGA